jgi:hypothetical protein
MFILISAAAEFDFTTIQGSVSTNSNHVPKQVFWLPTKSSIDMDLTPGHTSDDNEQEGRTGRYGSGALECIRM